MSPVVSLTARMRPSRAWSLNRVPRPGFTRYELNYTSEHPAPEVLSRLVTPCELGLLQVP
jgi:hypothetical protein